MKEIKNFLVFSFKIFIFVSMIFFIGSEAEAEGTNGPSEGISMVITDGTSVWPSNTFATAAQLSKSTNDMDRLKSEVENLRSELEGKISNLDSLIKSIGENGDIVSATTFVQSVGASSGSGTNQAIRIESMRITSDAVILVCSFDKEQGSLPSIRWSSSISNTSWNDVSGSTCSWPSTVECSTAPEGYFCYDFSIPRNGNSMFVRCVSTDTSGIGSGVYFIVRNGLSMNGRVGKTGTIIDDYGNSFTIIGGLIVEEVTE